MKWYVATIETLFVKSKQVEIRAESVEDAIRALQLTPAFVRIITNPTLK